MLTQFACEFVHYKLKLVVHVDRRNKETMAYASYDGRIVIKEDRWSHQLTDTPEKVQAHVNQPIGEFATYIEWLEYVYNPKRAKKRAFA